MRNSLITLLTAACMTALVSGCSSPTDDNPAGPQPLLTLTVEARPSAIPANGISRTVIFAELKRGDNAAADSTEVILLNSIGRLGRGIVYTRGGVALDTLTSDTTAALGWIVAYSQGVRDSVEIMFTTP